MIKFIPIVLLVLMLNGCASHIYPLKSQYNNDAMAIREYPAEKKDELWARIMTFFSSNNIPIRTIDKSAGFIKSELLDFKPYAWGEDVKNVSIDKRDKMIVTVQESQEPGDPPILPTFVTGAIKIYAIDSLGKLTVMVSIDDLAANDLNTYHYYNNRYYPLSYFEVHSLGKLEEVLSDYLIGTGVMPKCHFGTMNHN